MKTWNQVALTSFVLMAMVRTLSQPVSVATWHYQSVTFADGGTLTGTVPFDDTGRLTDVSIIMSDRAALLSNGLHVPGGAVGCGGPYPASFCAYGWNGSTDLEVSTPSGVDYFLTISFAQDISTLMTGTVGITGGYQSFDDPSRPGIRHINTAQQPIITSPLMTGMVGITGGYQSFDDPSHPGIRHIDTAQQPIITTPEPSATLLLALALAGLLGYGWRHRQRTAEASRRPRPAPPVGGEQGERGH